jgi:hypothetical protein
MNFPITFLILPTIAARFAKGMQQGEATFDIKALRRRFGKLKAQTEEKTALCPYKN